MEDEQIKESPAEEEVTDTREPQSPQTWEEWSKEPLPEALIAPYPLFALASAQEDTLPTDANLERWRSEKCLRKLWRRCTEMEGIEETAKEFLKRFGDADKAPHGVLLAAQETTYWLVGDVHGNAEGLMNAYAFAWARAKEQKGKHKFILLGDIIDRGDKDLEALALVESLMLMGNDAPVPVLYVCGNHDVGLNLQEDGKFASTVAPAETTDRLNTLEDKAAAEIIGRAAILLAQIAPCMGEIVGIHPDEPKKTLLFTHGGVPHVDLQEKVCKSRLEKETVQANAEPSKVNAIEAWPEDVRQACARDFVWIRMVDKLPHKIPNRGSSGCQIGTNDVNLFRKLHYALTGRAVSFIVRGHDHEDDGYRLYSAQEGVNENKRLQTNCGVLTINAMAPDDMAPNRCVCVLRCHQGDSLTLYKMGQTVEPRKEAASTETREEVQEILRATEKERDFWERCSDYCFTALCWFKRIMQREEREKGRTECENPESDS